MGRPVLGGRGRTWDVRPPRGVGIRPIVGWIAAATTVLPFSGVGALGPACKPVVLVEGPLGRTGSAAGTASAPRTSLAPGRPAGLRHRADREGADDGRPGPGRHASRA